ncbi:unnamed protein product [Nippostrongylus brasiliensis]|uniref:Glycosyltransferase family 92 protein n=1 Tax=Nippostrongylus brasiliensis TaxID=27835 RepID=A0A0N4YD64_NIPBR|nr:unnamed protein product [Nippostrongylus brasiliensis]
MAVEKCSKRLGLRSGRVDGIGYTCEGIWNISQRPSDFSRPSGHHRLNVELGRAKITCGEGEGAGTLGELDNGPQVLDDYVNTGEVEAIFYSKDVDVTQASAIMDCIIRSRYHSSYVIMSDLDERIVAGNTNESLVSLVLSTMERHKNVGSITFQSRFIFRTAELPSTYKGEKTLREHLPTLVFDNITLRVAYIRRKCIINPFRVLEMGVHAVHSFLGDYINLELPLSAGYVRHYRDPFYNTNLREKFVRMMERGKFETIEYPEHLIGQLLKNVRTRLDRVYKEDLLFSSRQENSQCINSTATKF